MHGGIGMQSVWRPLCVILLAIIYMVNCKPVQAHQSYEVISTEALAKKLANGESLCLINVLPRIIHDAKHIEGSINIPIGKIESSGKLPQNKAQRLIFYCMGTL